MWHMSFTSIIHAHCISFYSAMIVALAINLRCLGCCAYCCAHCAFDVNTQCSSVPCGTHYCPLSAISVSVTVAQCRKRRYLLSFCFAMALKATVLKPLPPLPHVAAIILPSDGLLKFKMKRQLKRGCVRWNE